MYIISIIFAEYVCFIMDQTICDNTEETQLIKSETQNQTAISQQLCGDLDANLVDIVPNDTGPLGYKCKVCQVFYPRKWHMKLHIRIHTGNLIFVIIINVIRPSQDQEPLVNIREETMRKFFSMFVPFVRRSFMVEVIC